VVTNLPAGNSAAAAEQAIVVVGTGLM